jgi:hypothetical protein
MPKNAMSGLVVKGLGDYPNAQELIQQAMEVARDKISKLPDADKLVDTDEGQALISKALREAIEGMNLEGVEVFTSDNIADQPEDVRESLENMMQMQNQDHELRGEAVKGVMLSLASYAVAVGQSRPVMQISLYQDMGQIVANAIMNIGSGAVQSHDDPFLPAIVGLCNRTSVISFLNMILMADDEQCKYSNLDKASIREDIQACLDGKSEDRLMSIMDTVKTYGEAKDAKDRGKSH